VKDVEGMEAQLQVLFIEALDGCERSPVREPSVSGLGRVLVVVERESWLFSRYSVTTLTELSRLITT
jgi:hypothetical protein